MPLETLGHGPASETTVLRSKRGGERVDPDTAPLAGTRFARFMQLPSRMDLSDELRREREHDAARAEQRTRSVSGRNLQAGDNAAAAASSFASLAPYAASEDLDGDVRDADGGDGGAGDDGWAPGRLSVSRTKSQSRLAAQAIDVGTKRAAARTLAAAHRAHGEGEDDADDWFSSIAKAFRRLC